MEKRMRLCIVEEKLIGTSINIHSLKVKKKKQCFQINIYLF